ncbi:FAD dependent oxidoreductase [Apiospora arundinis]
MFHQRLLAGLVHGLLICSVFSDHCPTCEYIFDDKDVIRRDVAIIGGGSSGTYTAVKLKDAGKSFIVVEPKDQLGGHTETYVDPNTGVPIDIGVIVFENTTTVKNYFARLGVSLVDIEGFGGNGTVPVDFSTGQIDATYPPPDQEAIAAALVGYAAQRAKYPALDTGFNLTYPVEPDLLLSFGEFLTKYHLEALAPVAFLVSQGITPYLNVSTLYVFKNFNPLQLAVPLLTTEQHATHELYAKALAELGPEHVLLRSNSTKIKYQMHA